MEFEARRRRARLRMVAGGLALVCSALIGAFAVVVLFDVPVFRRTEHPPTPAEVFEPVRLAAIVGGIAALFAALGGTLCAFAWWRLRALDVEEREAADGGAPWV